MSNTNTNGGSGRIHSLDAVRAIALLLGIVLHAALSFVPGVDERAWPVSDEQKSLAPALVLFVIHVFRMSVFFLVAGFFARLLLQRRGVAGFCRNRLMRIVVPLVLAWPVCFAAIGAVVVWVLTKNNGGQMPQALLPGMEEAGLNFLHLWFLYLLIWLYAITLLLRSLVLRLDRDGTWRARADAWFRRLIEFPVGFVVFAAPVMLALFSIPHWVANEGVPPPGYTMMPPLPALFIYTYVFLLGWMLDRQRALLQTLERRWPIHVGVGALATLACLVLIGIASGNFGDGAAKLHYAAWYALALVSGTFAFIGVGVKLFSNESKTLRYLSDASYWMYLAHLPLVMALQAAVMSLPLHWFVKFVLVNAIAFAVLLAAYRWLVRASWLGVLLNGRRYSASLAPAAA